MTTITRRGLGRLGTGLGFAAGFGLPAHAYDRPRELRVGYQKAGVPVVARRRGVIEEALAGSGTAVRWVEFTAGPPLLEAMNAGAVDLGWTGDAPPIFAQAAGAAIVYVAALPANGAGEAVIVKDGSPIRGLADLRGRRIGFTKGSSAHNLTVAALERAGIAYGSVTPVFLSPADAAAAFSRDAIDAWTIWDPFLAIAQGRAAVRVLATGRDVLDVRTYFLANRGFAARYPRTVRATADGLAGAAAWAADHRGEVAQALAEVTGVDIAAQTVAADRAEFGIGPLTDAVLAGQQATADRFHRLGLIPRAIVVRDAVWTPPQS